MLSQCSDRATREVIGALWRGRQLALPPEMRPAFAVPMTVVIFNRPPSPSAPGALGEVKKPGELNHHWTNVIKRTRPERESFAINLWGTDMRYSATFRFDLYTLLQRQAPAPPLWLKEGLFGGFGIYREGIGLDDPEKTKNIKPSNWCEKDELRNITRLWLEQEGTPQAKKMNPFPSAVAPYLTPLQAIFESLPSGDALEHDRWRCTASLFARWAIYSDPARESAFWNYVRLASAQTVSEDDFRRCFGKSYQQVHAELSWYVTTAVTQFSYAPANLKPLPKISLTPAKNSQVASVLGEWERMEAEVLAAKYPAIAQSYREDAAERLHRSYDNGNRPSALAATLGLLLIDTGKPAEARPYLEQAVTGKVPGPRVYLEFARLKLAEIQPGNASAAQEQLREVEELVLRAERQGPPMRATYSMLAEIAQRTSRGSADLQAALERGRSYFPPNPPRQ